MTDYNHHITSSSAQAVMNDLVALDKAGKSVYLNPLAFLYQKVTHNAFSKVALTPYTQSSALINMMVQHSLLLNLLNRIMGKLLVENITVTTRFKLRTGTSIRK